MSSLFPSDPLGSCSAKQTFILPVVTLSPQRVLPGFFGVGASSSGSAPVGDGEPPCLRKEECVAEGCSLCNGQLHHLAQQLRPQLEGFDEQQDLF
jgi:hypothetical protein